MYPDDRANVIPKRPDLLLNSCQKAITDTRQSTIRKQRMIVYYNFFHGSETEKKNIIDAKTIIDDIVKPPESKAFIGISQITQNTSFILTYLNENPDIFAKIIVGSNKSKKYQCFIRVIVPSLLGYYSSKEHLDMAFQVYSHILLIAPPQQAVDIISPLLNSGVTYRYIECALTRFFKIFHTDDETKYKIESMPKYARYFMECITEAIPLLPQQILDLLNSIDKAKWKGGFFPNLVLIRFIFQSAFFWYDTHKPPIPHSLLSRIFSEISHNCKLEILKFYQTIKNSWSIYEVPSAYKAFDTPFVLFFVNISNLIITANIMSTLKLMPPSISLSEFSSIDRNLHKISIWCQMYTQTSKNIRRQIRLFFDPIELRSEKEFSEVDKLSYSRTLNAIESRSDKEEVIKMVDPKSDFAVYIRYAHALKCESNAATFERFLIQRGDLKNLQLFDDLLNDAQLHYMSTALDTLSKVGETTESIGSLFAQSALQRRVVLNMLDNDIYPHIAGDALLMQILTKLDERWVSLVPELPRLMALPPVDAIFDGLGEKGRAAVAEGVRRLRTDSSKLSFVFCFEAILGFVRVLNLVDARFEIPVAEGKPKPLYTVEAVEIPYNRLCVNAAAFSRLCCPKFMSTFTLLNAFALGDYSHTHSFSAGEHELWFELERWMSACLSLDSVLMAALAQTQDLIATRIRGIR